MMRKHGSWSLETFVKIYNGNGKQQSLLGIKHPRKGNGVTSRGGMEVQQSPKENYMETTQEKQTVESTDS